MEYIHFRVYTTGKRKGQVIALLPGSPYGPGQIYAYIVPDEAFGVGYNVIYAVTRPALPREYEPLLKALAESEVGECMAINTNAAKQIEYRMRVAMYAPWVEPKREVYIPVDSDQ